MSHVTRSTLIALVCVSLLGGCKKGGADNAKDGSGGGAPASGGTPLVFKLTPEQFAKEFDADQAATAEKYARGWVEMSGVIDEVGVNLGGSSYVNLRAGPRKEASADGPAMTPVVQCRTTDPEPWAKLSPGQDATFRGRVGYLPLQPNLEDCDVVTAGPSKAVVVSASQLAADFAKGADAFRKTYGGKGMIVTGKVVEKKVDSTGAIALSLEGEGADRVRCDFGMIESVIRKVVPAVQEGQTVKVYGELPPEVKGRSALSLTSCRLVTK